MAITIRTVRDDELADFIEGVQTGFVERPGDPVKIADEMRPIWDLQRTWVAVDGPTVCGTYRSWATDITVPGGAQLPAAAIAAVTVRTTHRRQGILRRLTAAEHGAIRERGEVFALLHAAEYPIYGRFGYGPATEEAVWTVETSRASFLEEPSGSVAIVKPSPDARDRAEQVYEQWRIRETASLRRREASWDYDFGLIASAWGDDWKGFVAFHQDRDRVTDGYVRYGKGEDKWEFGQPRNVLRLDELIALDDAAYADLWRFLTEFDWVATIKAERRPVTERLPWILHNARAARMSEVGDDLWVRIFDVPRALAARTYVGEGSVILEVIDAEAVGGRLRVRLDAGPDGASCAPTTASPDLTLDVAALGAAYLGGTRLREAVLAQGVDEHRTGALLEVERLLRVSDAPWCSTFF